MSLVHPCYYQVQKKRSDQQLAFGEVNHFVFLLVCFIWCLKSRLRRFKIFSYSSSAQSLKHGRETRMEPEWRLVVERTC